jgi:hypothetical protein
MMIIYCDHLGDYEQKMKLPLLIKDNDYHRLWSFRGAVTMKRAKKDVRWAQDVFKRVVIYYTRKYKKFENQFLVMIWNC